ncbi:hypothetical protein ATANTOWER_006719 [Ataeniobius toweri]|uniref:Uncharacterized protein n=1 Tax=Ataeniobius toweri TaxID=208326 RepID=A0ABU7ABD4_9TELE|nr:hypothetical protein [Ataeniobius toweri]
MRRGSKRKEVKLAACGVSTVSKIIRQQSLQSGQAPADPLITQLIPTTSPEHNETVQTMCNWGWKVKGFQPADTADTTDADHSTTAYFIFKLNK